MGGSSEDYLVKLIMSMDNRSMLTAQKENVAASDEFKDATKANSDEESLSMDKVKEHTLMLRDAMTSLVGMVGIGGVAFGLKDLVVGGEKLQLAQSQLQATLRTTGQDAGGAASDLDRLAESMSTKGGFSDTENLAALTQFVSETHSATDAQKYLATATNLARDTGVSLATAQTDIAKAYDGSGKSLQALVGPMVASKNAEVGLTAAHAAQIAKLQEQASVLTGFAHAQAEQRIASMHLTAAQEEAAQLQDKQITGQKYLAVVTQAVAGSTSVYNKSVIGQQSNLRNSISNLADSYGKDLLPTFREVVTIGTGVADVMEHNKTEVEIATLAVGGLAAAWGTMKVLSGVKSMFMDVGKALGFVTAQETAAGAEGVAAADELTVAWDALMASTIVGLVIVGLVEMMTHWREVKQVAVEVWHDIESAAASMWHAIVSAAKWAIGEIKGLLKDLGFTGNGIMSYLNPIGMDRHIVSGIGSLFNQGGVVKHLASGGSIGYGTDTVPTELTPGEGVLSVQGMDMLSRLNSGMLGGLGGMGQSRVTVTPQSIIKLMTTDRALGQAVVRWALNEQARGTFSLTGGSLQVANGALAGLS
jgi:hypothetical protein